MKTTSLATILALALTTSAAAQSPPSSPGGPLYGLGGELIGDGSTPDSDLGGEFTNPFDGASIRALRRGLYEITLPETGTGWSETFLLGVPRVALSPAPLLVLFHSYGHTQLDTLYYTSYFADALERGWYVVAPLGAHKFNFGIDYAQDNVEVVLDWTQNYLPLDHERVYGIGFSMGGGMATSYAARHQDPGHLRFAALVNHTGLTSVADGYRQAVDTSLFDHELMFGGSPDAYPFRYDRASVFDLNPFTRTPLPATDLARNLARTPSRTFAVASDPNGYLVEQSEIFAAWLTRRGGTSELQIDAGSEHVWWTLDETAALDFLADKTLTDPAPRTSVPVLADRDGEWLFFDVEQRSAGAFTPFRFKAATQVNRLIIDQASNLTRIACAPDELDLDSASTMQVVVAATDGAPLAIELAGSTTPPSAVLRNGEATTSWSHDPATGVLTLHEFDPAAYRLWVIEP